MAKISISVSDKLLSFVDQKVNNRSALIEELLEKWQIQQQDEELANACQTIDELELGWDEEWQQAAITDLEASG
jgi:Arc/MetJ-type ribon-helix-helix transcriptional regulator